jgi:hypothetical protein
MATATIVRPQDFTLDEQKRIKRAIWNAVNYIAADAGDVSDEELIELALDADRMYNLGGEKMTEAWKALYAKFSLMKFKDMVKLATMKFPAVQR